jgi:hypothetical protein
MCEEAKQNDILRYNSKINELIREKAQLESEKKEFTNSLSIATESIKLYQDRLNKQKNIYEQKLFKANAKYEGLEKKYKNLSKQMRNKEKLLLSENKNLKHKITEIEAEKSQIEVQNKIQNMSNFNNNLNSSMMLNNNTMFNLPNVQSNLLNNSFTYNTSANNFGLLNQTPTFGTFTIKYDDPNEENQKKTLEDFKKLLAKIDEKLD